MKVATLSTLVIAALGVSAQTVSFLAPAPNTQIQAGQPFTATLQLHPTSSSEQIVALYLGVTFGTAESGDLGQKLAVVAEPTFPDTGPHGQIQQSFQLTIPSGLSGVQNLTVGEFYTVGAFNIPNLFTTNVPISITPA